MKLITPSAQTHELNLLSNVATSEHEAARNFCLATIKEVYGIDHRADWHADLDSLLLGEASWFSAKNGGAFWTVRDPRGELVATAGVYDLRLKPATRERLLERYPNGENVCQLVRVYVRQDRRGSNLGTMLTDVAETYASHQGYEIVYLHADAKAERTLKFWSSVGYQSFGVVTYPTASGTDTSVNFDKWIARAPAVRDAV